MTEEQERKDREKRLERFKYSGLDNRDLVSAAMCLETYINMQECKESENMKEYAREIIHKLFDAAGVFGDD